jgi:hypothetical protein
LCAVDRGAGRLLRTSRGSLQRSVHGRKGIAVRLRDRTRAGERKLSP